mmetsp:Transcript_6176/g.9019  ORF Transcript_6176/g.9019 Transcript_6176/m.9019 type:complete len:404 (+) Transcript_6176:239-1450(+)
MHHFYVYLIFSLIHQTLSTNRNVGLPRCLLYSFALRMATDETNENCHGSIITNTVLRMAHGTGREHQLSIVPRCDAPENVDNWKTCELGKKGRTPPSIPSRYMVPRLNPAESESNAFGTRTCRFQTLLAETPGPGAYCTVAECCVKDPALCGIARGYTTMTSKTSRFETASSDTPGPGAYDVATSIAIVPVGIANSHFFIPPPCHSKRSLDSKDTPGPGHYDVSTRGASSSSFVPYGSSAFKSTERGDMSILSNSNNSKIAAAVGSYNVAKSLDTLFNYGREDRHGKPFPSASFASCSKRNFDASPTTVTPGPGYYCRIDPRETTSSMRCRAHAIIRVSLRKKLHCCELGNDNRNNDTPGPGWYFTGHATSSKGITSVFKSMLPRFPNEQRSSAPGPAYYDLT